MDVLVIGLGNELRRDDGIGPYVAQAIAARRLPGLHTLAVPQLTPEIAEELSRTDAVIFVDAHVDPSGPPIEITQLAVADAPASMWHALQPAGLVALAQALFGRAPAAWSVVVAGDDFTIGEGLSPGGRQRADAAADYVAELVLRNCQCISRRPDRFRGRGRGA